VRLNYTYQEGEGGIADALSLAEAFADGDSICVILGDNIIFDNLSASVGDFRRQPCAAKILLKQVHDAQRFGVGEIRDVYVFGDAEQRPDHAGRGTD